MELTKALEGQVQELRVSNGTNVKQLATAILRFMEEGKKVSLACIGPQSQSQALKAVAVANGEMAPQGKILLVLPAFDVKVFADKDTRNSVEMTAIILHVVKAPVLMF